MKITEEELEGLKDDNGDIQYYKVVEHLLPRFNGDLFWEWLAARMRNYMLHHIRTDGYKPRYYVPGSEKAILGDHICRFFGCQTARMLRGLPSIDDIWSTRDSLDEVRCVTESMPKDTFKDLYRCLHFADHWEEDDNVNWDKVYPDKEVQVFRRGEAL